MNDLDYIDSNYNTSFHIKNWKLRCRPSCPALCCLQWDKVTVISCRRTKHERSQNC